MAKGGGSAVEEVLRWWNQPGEGVGVTAVEWGVQWGARGKRRRPGWHKFERTPAMTVADVVSKTGSSSQME